GDPAARPPLAPSADHERDARRRVRLWRVHQPRRVDVPPVEFCLGAALALPHLMGDLEGLFEDLETLPQRREGEAERPRLLLVPRRADPEPGPTPGEDVERRRRLDPQPRKAVMDTADHEPDAPS